MTVQELIDILKQYPSDSMVMVDGYMSAEDQDHTSYYGHIRYAVDLKPETIYKTLVLLNSDFEGYHSPISYDCDCDISEDCDCVRSTNATVEAVVLSRYED